MGPIKITDVAAEKFLNALVKETNPSIMLRVQVVGRGCGGLVYSLSLDKKQEGDEIFTTNGVDYLVDVVSIQHLGGATIDYVESGDDGAFMFDNPNDVPSCSPSACGGCPGQEH